MAKLILAQWAFLEILGGQEFLVCCFPNVDSLPRWSQVSSCLTFLIPFLFSSLHIHWLPRVFGPCERFFFRTPLDSVCPDWTDLGLTFSIITAGMNLRSLHLGLKPKCVSACAVTHFTAEFYQFITLTNLFFLIFCLSLQNAEVNSPNVQLVQRNQSGIHHRVLY